MPATCIVIGCGSRSRRDNVKFYSVPVILNNKSHPRRNELSKKRRKLWLAAINRDDLTFKTQKVCSKHFITGKCAALKDETHPDWVPSLNMGHVSHDENSIKTSNDCEIQIEDSSGQQLVKEEPSDGEEERQQGEDVSWNMLQEENQNITEDYECDNIDIMKEEELFQKALVKEEFVPETGQDTDTKQDQPYNMPNIEEEKETKKKKLSFAELLKLENVHKCQECEFSTSKRELLKRHMRKYHRTSHLVPKFECKYCGFRTIYPYSRQAHINDIHLRLKCLNASQCVDRHAKKKHKHEENT